MKKMREEQGHKVLPETFDQKELMLKNMLKNSIAIIPDDIVSGINDLTL